MNLEDRILNRIDQLLEKGLDKLTDFDDVSDTDAAEVSLAAINIFTTIYGAGSPQLDMVKATQQGMYNVTMVQVLHGYLRELKETIRGGLIVNIQSETRDEVLGNFLALAREALDAGQKDVAAVLACAALEDTLKRCASNRGLDIQDKDMSEVVNALKSKGIIGRPQGDMLRGYVQIRNKVFHAQWDAIDVAAVSGIIGFTQGFLTEQSVSPIPTDSPTDPPVEAQE